MKTPKRHYELTTMEHCATERVWDRPQEEVSAQRWKRKNRVARLKRSLHKYKHGTMLDGQYDLYLAWRWLQRLKKPGKAADSKSWENYIHKLGAIRGVIVYARQEAEKALQKALERELGKEQE